MRSFIDFHTLLSIFDVEAWIRYGGLLLVLLMIYGSTGLFFCFFLPSGAVMFTAGVFTATGGLHENIYTVCSLLVLASVLGNCTGYWFGWKAGPMLYKRRDSRFFRKHHLRTAETFYEKYGWLALTVGLYLLIIRTFAPIVAGMVRVKFQKFLLLTVTGSIVWVLSFTLSGYYLAGRPFLKPWLKYIVIVFILGVSIPLIIRVSRELKKMRKENERS